MKCLSCNFYNGLICRACENKLKHTGHLERFGFPKKLEEKLYTIQIMDSLLFYIEEHKKRIRPEWIIGSPAINKAYYFLDLLVKRLLTLK